MNEQTFTRPVVGQFFGIFKVSKDTFRSKVDKAPFDKTNLLLIAFLHTQKRGDDYVASYENARDGAPSVTGDSDADRIDYLVSRARARNPSMKVLISLGWGQRDVELATKTPEAFAASVKALVDKHKLDGFDIDYEEAQVGAADMLRLAGALRAALGAGRIMTITPAQVNGLTPDVLNVFDLVMPQSYDHGGNGTRVEPYQQMLGGYSKIVFGLNSEGSQERSDDPAKFVGLAKQNDAAGVFAWRLDTDTEVNGSPTFVTAARMWALMHGSTH